jgi:hypothetical protein
MHQPGDKVRIKSSGERGIIEAVSRDGVGVRVGDSLIELPSGGITNYSDAARRAWRDRPKRAGRPRLPAPRKRMVSLRMDLDVLDLMAQLAEHGMIASREQAINEWCRATALATLREAGLFEDSL